MKSIFVAAPFSSAGFLTACVMNVSIIEELERSRIFVRVDSRGIDKSGSLV